jgi:polyisoprenoid-binding protein YceI
MRKAFLAIAFFIVSTAAFAQVNKSLTKSLVTFKIKNAGFTISGIIKAVQADVAFNPANLAASKIDAIADVTTINTDNDLRDEHLKGEDFLNVAKYPAITMKSVSFSKKNSSNYVGQFNVTIKDKTKLISIPFSYNDAGSAVALKGTFKISRADFGIGKSSMLLSDEANITIEVEASK